jgi:hypothetical protein
MFMQGEESRTGDFQLRFLSRIFHFSGGSSANVNPTISIQSEIFIEGHASAWHWYDGGD